MAKVGVRHLGRDGGKHVFLLFWLGALQVLYLRSNRLTGTLPTELGGATELRYLLLQENLLEGEIPTEASGAHTHTSRTSRTHTCLTQTHSSLTHTSHTLPRVSPTCYGVLRSYTFSDSSMSSDDAFSLLLESALTLPRLFVPPRVSRHVPHSPNSASQICLHMDFCLFSCLFSCLQIGNLPNKCVFSPTHPFLPYVAPHFSHISHFNVSRLATFASSMASRLIRTVSTGPSLRKSARCTTCATCGCKTTASAARSPHRSAGCATCESSTSTTIWYVFSPTHPFLPYVAPHFFPYLTFFILLLLCNQIVGAVPSSIKNLTNLKILYVQNEQLEPVRNRYCRIRIPNVGKYNWRILRDGYSHYSSVTCDNPYPTGYAFNSLQASGGYDVEGDVTTLDEVASGASGASGSGSG